MARSRVGDWRALTFRGVVAVLFGLLTLVWPGLTVGALVLLFGAYSLVDGVFMLVAVATGAPEASQHRVALIVEGVAGVLVGIVTFVWPGITALAILYLIAAWAILTGVLELGAAVSLRRVITHEWILGITGALSVIFGIVLVVAPVSGALAITWVIGWYALFAGILLLYLAWQARRFEGGVGGGAEPMRPATA